MSPPLKMLKVLTTVVSPGRIQTLPLKKELVV